MTRYLLGKFLYGIGVMTGVTLLLVVLFFGFLSRTSDPAREIAGARADSLTLASIRQEYALNQPVGVQFLSYLNDVSPISWYSLHPESPVVYREQSYSVLTSVHFRHSVFVIKLPYFRSSYISGRPVSEVLSNVMPNTIVLALTAMLFALCAGIPLGVISALRKDTWLDRLILVSTTFGVSVPSFFFALLAAVLFGYLWHEYTGLNLHGGLFTLDDLGNGMVFTPQNLILPAFTLGVRPLSVLVQITRNSFLEVRKADYVRTARAKGVPERSVIFRHTLRNALNPVITSASGWFAGMLAGSVFVEYIFGWNGIGKEVINGLQNLDYPVVMGGILWVSFFFLIISLLTDVLYAWADPTVRR
jgi:peptide/nickel transport system permease protein